MEEIKIVYIPISELKPAPYNPREISRHDFEALKGSIQEFGFVDPVIVNKDNSIIGGHQRVDAAKELGIDAVPVVFVDVAGEQAKILNLALRHHKLKKYFCVIKTSNKKSKFLSLKNILLTPG